jgi:hypothetical protein
VLPKCLFFLEVVRKDFYNSLLGNSFFLSIVVG